MWWLTVLAALLLPVIYLLFAPFFIEIESTKGLYQFRFHHLFSVGVKLKNDSVYLSLRITWWEKEYDLLTSNNFKKKVADSKKAKRTGITKINMKSLLRVISSFKVNECHILFDTGDMPLNGILYPWFYLLSWKTGNTIMINFWGENVIILQTENSIARMLWTYIKS